MAHGAVTLNMAIPVMVMAILVMVTAIPLTVMAILVMVTAIPLMVMAPIHTPTQHPQHPLLQQKLNNSVSDRHVCQGMPVVCIQFSCRQLRLQG